MIDRETINGLLAEADHAESTGHNNGMVHLSPDFLRMVVGELEAGARIAAPLPPFESDQSTARLTSSESA